MYCMVYRRYRLYNNTIYSNSLLPKDRIFYIICVSFISFNPFPIFPPFPFCTILCKLSWKTMLFLHQSIILIHFPLFFARNINAQRICFCTIYESVWCKKCMPWRRREDNSQSNLRWVFEYTPTLHITINKSLN